MPPPPSVTPDILCAVRDGVATITLNRPQAVNAITREMRDGLARLFLWCADNTSDIRAVVLAGTGRGFCAGQDLKEQTAPMTPVERIEARLQSDFQTFLSNVPQPTIAALHGHTIGRGLEMALCCDIRIAADDLSLGLPEVKLGMIPANGGTQRLPRIVGLGRALHLVLTGERIDADRALAWGLVTQIVPRGALEATAQSLGEQLAAHAPVAMRYARRAMIEATQLGLASGLHLESTLAAALRTTSDAEEGPRAFREKREPRFTGQ